MSREVKVTYVLVDKISKEAAKIQKSIDKMESSFENIDKMSKEFKDNKGFGQFVSDANRRVKALNPKLDTMNRRLNNVNQAAKRASDSTEKFAENLDTADERAKELNSTLGQLNTAMRDYRDASKQAATAQRGLSSAMTPVTRKANNQANALDNVATSASEAAHAMDELIDRERELARVMTDKNNQAGYQRDVLRAINRESRDTGRSMDRLSRSSSRYAKTLREVRDYSFFGEGFDSGARLFQTFTKLLGILPLVGTGFAGLGNVISSLGTGVIALSASLGRLSGVLGAFGGLYASLGVSAFVGTGISKSVFEPALENAEALQKASEAVSEARARLSRASTESGKASAQASLNDALAEQARLQSTVTEGTRRYTKALDHLKETYKNVFSRESEKNLKGMALLLGRMANALERLAPHFDKVQAAMRRAGGRAASILGDPAVLYKAGQSLTLASSSIDRIAEIVDNLLPYFLELVVGAQKFADSILMSLQAWSRTKDDTKEVAKFSEKIHNFFDRSKDSLIVWKDVLFNLGGAFANIFNAASPVTAEFEENLVSLTKRFKDWTDPQGGNFDRIRRFFEDTKDILDAVGRVALSIFKAFGAFAGGGDPSQGKRTVDVMVEFLDTLAGGIENFGRWGNQSLIKVGEALNGFWDSLGDLAGSVDLLDTVAGIIDMFKTMFDILAKINNMPVIGDILETILKLRLAMFAFGTVVGNILGPFSRFLKYFQLWAAYINGMSLKNLAAMSRGGGGGLFPVATGGRKGGGGLFPVAAGGAAVGAGGTAFGRGYARERAAGGGRFSAMKRGATGSYMGMTRGMSSGGRAAMGARAAGPLAGIMAGFELFETITNDDLTGRQKVGESAHSATKWGGAVAGAAAGQALIPIPVLGALIGGAAGYFGGDMLGGAISSKIDGGRTDRANYDNLKREYDKLAKQVADMQDYAGDRRSDMMGTLDLTTEEGRIMGQLALEESGMTTEEARVARLTDQRVQFRKETNAAVDWLIANPKKQEQLGQAMPGLSQSQINAANVRANGAEGAAARSSMADVVEDAEGNRTTHILMRGASGAEVEMMNNLNDGNVYENAYQKRHRENLARFEEQYGPLASAARELDEQLEGFDEKVREKHEELDNLALDLFGEDSVYLENIQALSGLTKEGIDSASTEFEAATGRLIGVMTTQAGEVKVKIDEYGNIISGSIDNWSIDLNAEGSATDLQFGGAFTSGTNADISAATGAWIPGNPKHGDVVPVMAAGGEVILNEDQQNKIGKGKIAAALAGASRKHHLSFAGGGVVPELNQYMNMAKQLGGIITSTTGGKHAPNSYHYSGRAFDVSGSPAVMAGIFNTMLPSARTGRLAELFYDPLGGWKHGQSIGAIGGHMDHVHVAVASALEAIFGAAGGVTPTLPELPDFGRKHMGRKTKELAQKKKDQLQEQVNSMLSAGNFAMGAHAPAAGSAKEYAQGLMGGFGWGPGQWSALNELWRRESGWNHTVWNTEGSGAYGIPQALPASKMASEGSDYMTNPHTQVRWGMKYIKGRYGTPAAALAFHDKMNWYKHGGDFIAKKPQVIGVGDGGAERVQITPMRKRREASGDGGGGTVVHAQVVISGSNFIDSKAVEPLAEAVGRHVAKRVGSTMRNTSKNKDI